MILFVKTSLISIMIRIWSPHRRKAISLYIFLAFIISYYVVILFVKIFTCMPISLYWDVHRHDGMCLNRAAIIIADAVISTVTDLAILIFPIILTWNMNMPATRKLHAIAMLGAGSIAIAFSVYRLALSINGGDGSPQVKLLLKVLLSE